LEPFEVLIDSIGLAIIEHLIDDAYLGGEVAAAASRALLVTYLLEWLIVQFNHVFAYTFYVFRFSRQVHETRAQKLI
jgi:hypothetical protein